MMIIIINFLATVLKSSGAEN